MLQPKLGHTASPIKSYSVKYRAACRIKSAVDAFKEKLADEKYPDPLLP